MITGTIKFDGISVAALEAVLVPTKDGPGDGIISLEATIAFINNKTGLTHGRAGSKGVKWSKQTIEALKELCRCIETDVAPLHLEDAGLVNTEDKGLKMVGLGEHLVDEEPKSV